MWTLDVYARSALPPALALFVIVSSTLALVAAMVAGFRRTRRREALAAAAEASVGEHPPALVEGRDVVLAGIVRHFSDHEVAVKVSITQTGTESESSGSWSHAWTEIDRDIVLAPFLLELHDGEVVLVTPPRNVEVADALDQKVWIHRNKRVLSAELVPGEHIYARGRLERSDHTAAGTSYRDVKWGWALGPSGEQMLLSSEPLGRGLRQRAAFHLGFAALALTCLLAVQASLLPFYGRMAGHTEAREVTATNEYETTDSDGDTTYHFALALRGGGSVEIDGDDYATVREGALLPIRLGSQWNWNLGASATITIWHGGIMFVGTLVMLLLYRSRRRASRPWFRREVHEKGSGKLPDPPAPPRRG